MDHDFKRAAFTGALICTACHLMPLDDDDLDSECEPSIRIEDIDDYSRLERRLILI